MFNISRLREHPHGPGVWKFLSNSYCVGISRSILLNLVKPGSFVLRTKKVTPDFTKIQLYPLSTYILPNGVFSFIPFLYIFCQMGFSVLSPFSIYSVKWGFQFYPLSLQMDKANLYRTPLSSAVAAQTRPGGSAVCAATAKRGCVKISLIHWKKSSILSRADPSSGSAVCARQDRGLLSTDKSCFAV